MKYQKCDYDSLNYKKILSRYHDGESLISIAQSVGCNVLSLKLNINKRYPDMVWRTQSQANKIGAKARKERKRSVLPPMKRELLEDLPPFSKMVAEIIFLAIEDYIAMNEDGSPPTTIDLVNRLRDEQP